MVTLGELAGWVRDRGIAAGVLPVVQPADGRHRRVRRGHRSHPFDLLYQLGFKVTINTDNRLMSGVTLSDEYELLVETFDYDLDDLLEITLNAAEAAFLPLEEREALVEYIGEGFRRPGLGTADAGRPLRGGGGHAGGAAIRPACASTAPGRAP